MEGKTENNQEIRSEEQSQLSLNSEHPFLGNSNLSRIAISTKAEDLFPGASIFMPPTQNLLRLCSVHR
jgi:hypothetical protein